MHDIIFDRNHFISCCINEQYMLYSYLSGPLFLIPAGKFYSLIFSGIRLKHQCDVLIWINSENTPCKHSQNIERMSYNPRNYHGNTSRTYRRNRKTPVYLCDSLCNSFEVYYWHRPLAPVESILLRCFSLEYLNLTL